MPPTMCSYVKCRNTSKNFSMFRFPTGNTDRTAHWLNNCGNPAITHLTHHELRNRYLCITHFADKFIQNRSGKRVRITRLAVPRNHNDEQSSDMTPPSTQCDDNSPCPSASQASGSKKKWQALRDAYRRALNKKKRKGKHETKNMKPWRYEAEMAFVAPFIVERKTKDSVGVTSGDEQSDNGEENNATELNTSEKPCTDIEVEDTAAEISDANSAISDEVPLNELQKIDTKLPNGREDKSIQKKRKVDQSEPAQTRDLSSEKSVRAILLSKLLDEQNKLEPPRGHDELDRFFLSIADTVKKFPPYVQALTKNKIFSLVSEVELQQLAPSSSTFNPSPQTTSAIPTPTCPDNQNEQIQQFFQKFNTHT